MRGVGTCQGRRLRLSNEAEMSFGNSDGSLLLAGIPGGADSSGPARPVGSRPGCIRSARFRLFAAPASMDPVSGAKQGRKLPGDLLQFTYVTIFQIVFQLVGKLSIFRAEADATGARVALLFSRKQGKRGNTPNSETQPVVKKAAGRALRSGELEAPAALGFPPQFRFSGRRPPPGGACSSTPRP